MKKLILLIAVVVLSINYCSAQDIYGNAFPRKFGNFAPTTLTGTTVTVDSELNDEFIITLTNNTTFMIANMQEGDKLIVTVINPDVYTVTFTGVHWKDGLDPESSIFATDFFQFYYTGGIIYGFVSQNF